MSIDYWGPPRPNPGTGSGGTGPPRPNPPKKKKKRPKPDPKPKPNPKKKGGAAQASIDMVKRAAAAKRRAQQAALRNRQHNRRQNERRVNQQAQARLRRDADRQAKKVIDGAAAQSLREISLAAARRAAYEEVQRRASSYLKQLDAYTSRESLIMKNPMLSMFSGSSIAHPREPRSVAEIVADLDSQRKLQTARGGQYHDFSRIKRLSGRLDTIGNAAIKRHADLDEKADRLYERWKGGSKAAGKQFTELYNGPIKQHLKHIDELFGNAPGALGAVDVAYHRINQMQTTYEKVMEQQLDKYIRQHQPGPTLTGRASLPGYGNALKPPIIADPNTKDPKVAGVANPYYGMSTLEAKQAIAVGLEERERIILKRFFDTYSGKPQGVFGLGKYYLPDTLDSPGVASLNKANEFQERAEGLYLAPLFTEAAKQLGIDATKIEDQSSPLVVRNIIDRAVANFRAPLMARYGFASPVYTVAGGGTAFAAPALPADQEAKVAQFEKHMWLLVTDKDPPSKLERMLEYGLQTPFVNDAMLAMGGLGAIIQTPQGFIKAVFGALGAELVAPQLHHEALFDNKDSDPAEIIKFLPRHMQSAFGTPSNWRGSELVKWQTTTAEGIAWYKMYKKSHPAYGGLIEFPNPFDYNATLIPGFGTRFNPIAVQAEFDTLATQVRESGALAGPLEQFWAIVDAWNIYSEEPFSSEQGNVGNILAALSPLGIPAKPGVLARIAMEAWRARKGVKPVDLTNKAWTTMDLLKHYRFGTKQTKEIVPAMVPKADGTWEKIDNFRQFRDPLKEIKEFRVIQKYLPEKTPGVPYTEEELATAFAATLKKLGPDPTAMDFLSVLGRQFNADLTQKSQLHAAVQDYLKHYFSEKHIESISFTRRTLVENRLKEINRSIDRFDEIARKEQAAVADAGRQRGRGFGSRRARMKKQGLKHERSILETEDDFFDPGFKPTEKNYPRVGDYRAPVAHQANKRVAVKRYGRNLMRSPSIAHAYAYSQDRHAQDLIALADGIARDHNLGIRWVRGRAGLIEGQPVVEFFGPTDEVQMAAMKLDDAMHKMRLGTDVRSGDDLNLKAVSSGRVTYRDAYADPQDDLRSRQGLIKPSRDLIDKKLKARRLASQVRQKLTELQPELEKALDAYQKSLSQASKSIPGEAGFTAGHVVKMEKLLARTQSLQRLARDLEQTGDLPAHVTLANKDFVLEGLRRDERFVLRERDRLTFKLAKAPNENARKVIQARIDWLNDAIEGLKLLRGDRLGNFWLAENLVKEYGDDAMQFVNGHSVAPLITSEADAVLTAGQQVWNLIQRTGKGGTYKPDEREEAAIRSMAIVRPMLAKLPSPNVEALGLHIDGPFEAVFPVIDQMIRHDAEMAKVFEPWLNALRDAVMAGPQTRARVKVERNLAARELIRLRKEAAQAKMRAKAAADAAVKQAEENLRNLDHLLNVTKDLRITEAPKPNFYVRFAPGKFAHSGTIKKQLKSIAERVPDHNVVVRVDRTRGSASAAAVVAKKLGFSVEYIDEVPVQYPHGTVFTGGRPGLEGFQAADESTIGKGVYLSDMPGAQHYAERRAETRRLPKGEVRAVVIPSGNYLDLVGKPVPADLAARWRDHLRALEIAPENWALENNRRDLMGVVNAHIKIAPKPFSRHFVGGFDSEWTKFLQSEGYVGLRATEGGEGPRAIDHLTVLVFDPTQVKLARPLPQQPDDVVIGMRVKTDVPFEPVIGTPRSVDITKFSFHSGGAFGADSMWDRVIKEFGGKVTHWVAPDMQPAGDIGNSIFVHTNPQRIAQQDAAVNRAAANMGRWAPRPGSRSKDRVKDHQWVTVWDAMSHKLTSIQTNLKAADKNWLEDYFDENGRYVYGEGGRKFPINPSREMAERHALYLDGRQDYTSLMLALESTRARRAKAIFVDGMTAQEKNAWYKHLQAEQGQPVPRQYTVKGKPNYARLLHRRNYEIVVNSDEVFAIGQDLSAVAKRQATKKEPNPKGYFPVPTFTKGLNGKMVLNGGTGMGVQMAIDLGKPVHVYDPLTAQWYKWDNLSGEVGAWIVEPTPVLTERAGLIGSRTVRRPVWRDKEIVGKEDNPDILAVMREVVQKTIGADSEQSLHSLNTDEWNTVLRARSVQSSMPKPVGWEAEVVARSGTQEALGEFLDRLLLKTKYEYEATQGGYVIKAGSMDDLRLISEAVSTGANRLIAEPGAPMPVMQRIGMLPEHPPDGVKEVSRAGRFRLYRTEGVARDTREAERSARLGGGWPVYHMQVTDNDMKGIQELADANGVELTIRRGYLRRVKQEVVDTKRFEEDLEAYNQRFYKSERALGQDMNQQPTGFADVTRTTTVVEDGVTKSLLDKRKKTVQMESTYNQPQAPTIDDVEDAWDDIEVTADMSATTRLGENNTGARQRVNRGKPKYKKTIVNEYYDETEGGWTVTFGFRNAAGNVNNERRFVRNQMKPWTKKLDAFSFDHPEVQNLTFKGVTPGPGAEIKEGHRRVHGNVFAKFNDGKATSWRNGIPRPVVTGKPMKEAPVHFTNKRFDEMGVKRKSRAKGEAAFRPITYESERLEPGMMAWKDSDLWGMVESEHGEYFAGTPADTIRKQAEMEPMDAKMPKQSVQPVGGYFDPAATVEEMASDILTRIGLDAASFPTLQAKLAETIVRGIDRQGYRRASRTTVWNRAFDAPSEAQITKRELDAGAGVYVGHGTKSGSIESTPFFNRFRLKNGDPQVAKYLAKFVEDLLNDEVTIGEYGVFIDEVLALHGRRLVGWDKPEVGHADVIALWLEAVANKSGAPIRPGADETARAMAGHPLRGFPVKPPVNPNTVTDETIAEAEKSGNRVLVYEAGKWNRRGDWSRRLPVTGQASPVAAAPPAGGGTGGPPPPQPPPAGSAGATGPGPTVPPRQQSYAPDPEIPTEILKKNSPLEIARFLYAGHDAAFKEETILTFDGMVKLNKIVSDAIAATRGWRAKSAGRGPRFRVPDKELGEAADDLDAAVKAMQSVAVTTNDVRIMLAISKALAKEGVSLEAYQDALGVFRPAMVKSMRSRQVLKQMGTNGTDFLTERQGYVRQESNARLRNFANGAPYGMSAARAWEEFQLAHQRPFEEPVERAFSGYQQDVANQGIRDLLGVEPTDLEGVTDALKPIAPPDHNQAEARRWLMMRGVWTPRQAAEVWGSDKEGWTAKDEYDYYFKTWGVRPKWADTEYFLAKKAFDSQHAYEKLAMDLGIYDRTVDVQMAMSRDPSIKQKLALVYGDVDQGIKPARSIDEQREYMIHRWGDAIARPISGEGGTIFPSVPRMTPLTDMSKLNTHDRVEWGARDEIEKAFRGEGAVGTDDATKLAMSPPRIGRAGPIEYQLVRAPWLMDPRSAEYHRFMGNAVRDLVDTSLIEPEMVDALAKQIAEVTEKRVNLVLNNLVDNRTLDSEMNRLSLEIVDALLDDPRWKPRFRLSKPKALGGSGKRWYIGRQPSAYYLLSLIGKIQRLDVVTQIAFPMMNRFEISRVGPKRFVLWAGSRHFSDIPDSAIEMLNQRIPTLESIGVSGDATSMWTMMSRSNWQRLEDAVEEIKDYGWNRETTWDAFTATAGSAYEWGLLISRNAENELRLGFAKRAYWDRYSSYLDLGMSETEADVLARLATRDIVNHFFLTNEDSSTFVKVLNQLIPFFSYNWNTKTLYVREFLSHPWLLYMMDQVGQVVEDWNREEWERKHPGLPYPDESKVRMLNIDINGETYTFNLLNTSDVFRGVDTLALMANGATLGKTFQHFFRVPHPWQERLIKSLMGEDKWKEVIWELGIIDWFNQLAKDGEVSAGDIMLLATKLGTFQTMYPLSVYKALNTAYHALPTENQRKDFLAAHPELQLEWHNRDVGGENWYKHHTPEEIAAYHVALAGIASLRDYWNDQLDAYLEGGGDPRSDEYKRMKASYRYDVLVFKNQNQILLDSEAYYMTPDDWRAQEETWATEDLAQQFYAMDDAIPLREEFKTEAAFREALDDFYDMKEQFLIDNPSVKELWARDKSDMQAAIQDQLDHAQDVYERINEIRKDIVQFEKDGREDMAKAAYDLIGLKYTGIDIPTKAAMLDNPLELDASSMNLAGATPKDIQDYFATRGALERSVIIPGATDHAFYNGTPQERDKMLLDYMFRTNKPIDPNMLSSRSGEVGRLVDLISKVQKTGSWDGFWNVLNKDAKLREYWFGLDPTGQREQNWKDGKRYISLIGPAAALGKRTGDWSRFWDLINNNQFVREMYFKNNPGAEAKYIQNGQYLGAMERWTTLLDQNKFERAREYFASLPGWMKKKYYAKHPESLKSMQQTAYVGYMQKWVNYFENDNGSAGMDYFWNMPEWVREHYFKTHPGKEADFRADREYFKYMGGWIRLLEANNPKSFAYFDALPDWVKARYRKNNPDSKMFGRRGGMSDAQYKAYGNYMKTWIGMMKRNDSGAFDYFDSMPQWVKDQYRKNNPDSGMFGGRKGGMSDEQYKAYGNYMKTWMGMMDRNDPGSFAYFDSMPQWVKDQYRKNNPDSKMFGGRKGGKGNIFGGNWGYYSKSGYSWQDDEVNAKELGAYLMLHPQDQLEYLGSHPEFAAYLKGRDDGQWSHRQMILNAFLGLPDDPWIKRAFKERYPEVFSDEALGEYKTAKVEAKLLAAPALREGYAEALSYLSQTYLGQVNRYGALPQRPELTHQTSLIRKRRKKRLARNGALHEWDIPKLPRTVPGLYNVRQGIA